MAVVSFLKRELDREGQMIDRSLPGALLLPLEDGGKHTGGPGGEEGGKEIVELISVAPSSLPAHFISVAPSSLPAEEGSSTERGR